MSTFLWRTTGFVMLAVLMSLGPTSLAQTKPGLGTASKSPADKAIDGAFSKLRTMRRPADGVALLTTLLEDKTFSAVQRQKVARELEVWQKREADKLVRSGTSWITAEEKTRREKEADLLIEKAFLLIDTKDYRSAREALEKASRTDDAGLRADFLLGLLNTPILANSPETAEKHFRKVLTRSPNHIPTLNNLALCCVRQKEFSKAYECWRQLGEVAPNTPELSHNLGRLLDESGKGLINLGNSEKKRFQDLYLDIATGENAPDRYKQGGWRYMHLTLPKEEADRTPVRDVSSLILAASGTGFAILPGVVLTNRHVVNDAHSIRVDVETASGWTSLEAKVKAVSDTLDLAIVECPKLVSPAVQVSTGAQRRGSEVMILGYPKPGALGRTLKTTRGSVTALPSSDYDGMLLFDATANPGNSGGPIVDQNGNVIAVLTVGFDLKGQLTGGVTMSDALKFIQFHYGDYQPKQGGKKLEWPDVDELIAKSTVMVGVYQQVVKLGAGTGGAAGQATKSSGSYIEDNACSFCGGSQMVTCSAKGCSRGGMSVTETVQAGTNPVTGQALFKSVTRKVSCGTCGGTGKIDCPRCH